MGVLFTGMFMALLDQSVVTVALPSIRTTLDASGAALSWTISGYMLAFGLALIPSGRLGDRIGHKRVFMIGIGVFTLASLACALAVTPEYLVASRIVQGLGGGIFLPAVTAFIQLLFTDRDRGRAFAIMGGVIGAALALGPIVGGLLISGLGDENGWRAVFMINLPIGVVALVAAAVLLPAPEQRGSTLGLDGVGLAILALALIALLVPLVEAQAAGWPVWSFVLFGAGVALLALFAVWEGSFARRGRTPLVPPRLFARGAFRGGAILALVYFAALPGALFAVSLLWQAGLGHSALESGLVGTPFALGSILGALRSGRLADRLGRAVLVWGVGMVAAGYASVSILVAVIEPERLAGWMLALPLFVAGAGSGLSIGPNARFAIATVERGDAGVASGVINTMQRLGTAVGIAIVSSVLFGVLSGSADVAVYARGAATAIAVCAGLAAVAFVFVFALPKRLPLPA